VVKPLGSDFYPFWTMNNSQGLGTRLLRGACVWNFGNVLPQTDRTFGKDAEYGTPDLARFGGTVISPVQANPALFSRGCRPVHL
jgi:hypothetical protein